MSRQGLVALGLLIISITILLLFKRNIKETFDSTILTNIYSEGMITDPSGKFLYVTDIINNTIRKVVIATGQSTTLVGPNQYFRRISGITIDPSGQNLYVTDPGNNTIYKIVISTSEVTTFAGSGMFSSINGIGRNASFSVPIGITIDPSGQNLYVTEFFNNTIRKIVIETAEVTTLAGSSHSGSTDGNGLTATFSNPSGIIIDPSGQNLYVADSFNNTIRKIVIATGQVTTLGDAETFMIPFGITIDKNGNNLYVTSLLDYNNIHKVSINDEVITTISTGTNYENTSRNYVSVITIGKSGKIYIISSGNLYSISNSSCPPGKILLSDDDNCIIDRQVIKYMIKTYKPFGKSVYNNYPNISLILTKNTELCPPNSTDPCCIDNSSINIDCIKKKIWKPSYAFDTNF